MLRFRYFLSIQLTLRARLTRVLSMHSAFCGTRRRHLDLVRRAGGSCRTR